MEGVGISKGDIGGLGEEVGNIKQQQSITLIQRKVSAMCPMALCANFKNE